jgi:uncharacterized protein (UPF0276 family)
MPPIRLAVMASAILYDLWSSEAVHPDLIEVPTWMPIEEVRLYRQLLPEQSLLVHGGNLLGAPLAEAQAQALSVLVKESRTPWVSAHISLWPWKVLQEARQRGRQPTALDLGSHLERFFVRVRTLREYLGVPLVLENAPGLPGWSNDPESDPETIAAVLEATGCNFLLDLSYAQTAASNWGSSPEQYLERLPLGRVVEIHVSAPSLMGNGRMVDIHDPLREEDYYLLGWLLERTTPQTVTLEYWKEPRALHEQVMRLRNEIAKKRVLRTL